MSGLDAFLCGRRKAQISVDRTWIDLVADRHIPSKSGPLKPPHVKRERLGLHAALMLDRLVFWADKNGAVPGWVYKSYKDWEDSCALTRREAEGATERLRQCHFIETKVAKPPGKDAPVLHYRLKVEVIQAALARHVAEQAEALPEEISTISPYGESLTDENSSISPYGESTSPQGESLTAVPSSQILPETANAPVIPDPRARNTYPPARGQSGTSPHPAILPETPDVPSVVAGAHPPLPPEAEDSVGRLPQAAALSAKAAQPEAPASVAEAEGESPAPEHPTVSVVLPCTEAAPCSGAPAAPLAASPGGAFRGSRAEGAYTRAAPPPAECGHTYRRAWEDGPPEVGQARTVRGTGLYSPGFLHLLKTRYGEEFAYA